MLGCYDRVVLNGTLMAIAHPEAMAGVLRREGIRCFDLARFVEPLREEIRQNAERLAAEAGLTIEFLAGHTVRKEDLVAEKLAQRGRQPGLVCIFSVMETCTTYRPWHDKASGRTGVKFAPGKCLHYYFYFIDPELGLLGNIVIPARDDNGPGARHSLVHFETNNSVVDNPDSYAFLQDRGVAVVRVLVSRPFLHGELVPIDCPGA